MSLLDLLILIPILGAVAVFLAPSTRLAAVGAAGVNAVLVGVVAVRFPVAEATRGFKFFASRSILDSPELNYAVGIDGMALVMVVLTAIVTLCAVWVSPKAQSPLFYASSLLISAGAMGAFVSTDLFFFYAFHEVALIPTFLMIGIWGYGDRWAAAWKITIYLAVGSVVLLVGLVALYLNLSGEGTLTFDMITLAENAKAGTVDAGTQAWIFVTLLVGFGILISLFPFHSWATPAYAAAPTPTAMLHAGVLKKFGLYGLMRVALPMLPQGAQTEWVQNLILLLLLGNVLVIGLITIAQRRLDGMLASSSVMHMGFVFLGIASYNVIGLSGAVLLMFAHGISIALLFALCGEVRDRVGTTEFERLGGLAKTAPFLGLAFGFAAFASIGLPGFANFASELMIFFGGFKDYDPAVGFSRLQWTTVFALWGVVISAVYMLRGYRAIFQGELAPNRTLTDPPLIQKIPVVLMIAVLLVVGIMPGGLLEWIRPGAEALAETLKEAAGR